MHAPIFVVGLGISGTTFLRLLLHHHPRIAIPYESHFIPKYWSRLGNYGDLANRTNLRGLVGDILKEPLLQMNVGSRVERRCCIRRVATCADT